MTGQGNVRFYGSIEKKASCQKKELPILQGEAKDMPPMPPAYIPTAPQLGAANLPLPGSLPASVTPLPPDAPEAIVSP